jgi:hypothetical protein
VGTELWLTNNLLWPKKGAERTPAGRGGGSAPATKTARPGQDVARVGLGEEDEGPTGVGRHWKGAQGRLGCGGHGAVEGARVRVRRRARPP